MYAVNSKYKHFKQMAYDKVYKQVLYPKNGMRYLVWRGYMKHCGSLLYTCVRQ